MSEPEIARRCSACGASVRQSAAFCPQCGNPMSDSIPEPGSKEGPTVPLSTSKYTEAELPGTASDERRAVPTTSAAQFARKEKSLSTGRDAIHRATEAARGAIEDNVRRVEKIRKVSGVVIDEAAYDPSLRFLLVAAVLFIFFLVLLFLSKMIG